MVDEDTAMGDVDAPAGGATDGKGVQGDGVEGRKASDAVRIVATVHDRAHCANFFPGVGQMTGSCLRVRQMAAFARVNSGETP